MTPLDALCSFLLRIRGLDLDEAGVRQHVQSRHQARTHVVVLFGEVVLEKSLVSSLHALEICQPQRLRLPIFRRKVDLLLNEATKRVPHYAMVNPLRSPTRRLALV